MKQIILFAFLLCAVCTTAQVKIPIVPNDVFNAVNGDMACDFSRMFDGDTTNHLHPGYYSPTAVSAGRDLPYQSWVRLNPTTYNITSIQYRVENGSNYFDPGSPSKFYVRFYNPSRVQVGDTAIMDCAVTGTFTIPVPANLNNIAFISFSSNDISAIKSNIAEVRVYGTATATTVPAFWNTAAAFTPTDLGQYSMGVNSLNGGVIRYPYGASPSNYFYPKVAGSVRVYVHKNDVDKWPSIVNNSVQYSDFWVGRFYNQSPPDIGGFDWLRDWMKFTKDTLKMKTHFAWTGGTLKYLQAGNTNVQGTIYDTTSSPNTSYLEAGQWLYKNPGSNPNDSVSWRGEEKIHRIITALYGNNASASFGGVNVSGGVISKGQGIMDYVETGNEEMSRYKQDSARMQPLAYYLQTLSAYKGAKSADASTPVIMSALTDFDSTFWRAEYWWHVWLNGNNTTPFPADIIAFNQYFNDSATSSIGQSPEKWQLDQKMALISALNKKTFNKPFEWTEFGFPVAASGSPFGVQAVGSKTERQVAADYTLRAVNVAETHNDLMQATLYYAAFDDGTFQYGSASILRDTFAPPPIYTYLGSYIYPNGYALAQHRYVQTNYPFAATLVKNGADTGVWVTMKTSNVTSAKKLYKVWRGSSTGATGNYVLSVPSATSVKMYTQNYTSFLPDSTNLVITSNTVTVPASESTQWVEVTTAGGNISPTATGVFNSPIYVGGPILQLSGNKSTDSDGTIASYAWTRISGPNTPTIVSPSSSVTNVTGTVAGAYVFRLTVTDNLGATGFVDVPVNVTTLNSAPTFFVPFIKQ